MHGFLCDPCPAGMIGDGRWCREQTPCDLAAQASPAPPATPCKPGFPCPEQLIVKPEPGSRKCNKICDLNPCPAGTSRALLFGSSALNWK